MRFATVAALVVAAAAGAHADTCDANERVSGGACIPCDTGYLNAAGDDDQTGDTVCTECAANYRATGSNNVCVECGTGYINAAGDSNAGAATECGECAEGYRSDGNGVCVECGTGYINAAGDSNTGAATQCTECAEGYRVDAAAHTCVQCDMHYFNAAGDDRNAPQDTVCEATCATMTCPMGWTDVPPNLVVNNGVCASATCDTNECCFFTCAVTQSDGEPPSTVDTALNTGFACGGSGSGPRYPAVATGYWTDPCLAIGAGGAQIVCTPEMCCTTTCGDTTSGDDVEQEVDCSSMNPGESNDYVNSPAKRCGGANAPDNDACNPSTCCMATGGGDGDSDSAAGAIEAGGIAAAAAVVAYAL